MKKEIRFNHKPVKFSKETEEKIKNKTKILINKLRQFTKGDKNEK